MNGDKDYDWDGTAERLLLDTVDDLQKSALVSLNDPKLSLWGQGRVLHGKLLIDQNMEATLDLIKAVCDATPSPQIRSTVINHLRLLMIGAFKIGQGSEPPADQKEHENEQRTRAAHEGRREKSGKGDRLEAVRDVLARDDDRNLPTHILLKRVNTLLRERGLEEIKTKTLLRYKAESESEGLSDDGCTEIASAFLRSE